MESATMRHYRSSIITLLVISILTFMVFNCIDNATNPFTADKAKVTLILESSEFAENDTAITDTVGNKIRIGLCLYLINHIDSATVVVAQSLSSVDTAITVIPKQKDTLTDTVWINVVFSKPGNRTVTATGYVGKSLRPGARAIIHVIGRPIPNRKPLLTVAGNRTVVAGQTCSLSVGAIEQDSGQIVTIDTLRRPAGSLLLNDTFTWTTTLADTGVDTAVFIATDNGTPPLSDTETVAISVTAPGVNRPPKWDTDTIVRPAFVGSLLSLTLDDLCSDPDNDSLRFLLVPGTPAHDTVLSATYTFAPSAGDTGLFLVHIAATDPKGAADTLTLKLNVTAVDRDSLPPVIMLVTPSKDTIIGSDSCMMRMTCTDASGIASVVCALGTQTFTATKSPTTDLYIATVKGMAAGVYSTVTITATDVSTARNVATASVKIKYDNDRTPPAIARLDPARDSANINANSYAVKVVCKDASGVASVVYTLGIGTFPATKGAGDTIWSANVTGLASGAYNKIIAIATDSSLRANKDTLTISINYDPTMTDSVGPIIFHESGPATGAIVIDSIITIIDSIYDPSGIDSVYWTLNNAYKQRMTGSNNKYTLVDTLRRFGLDTITVTAVDNATAGNRSSQTVILNYALPAGITTPLPTTTTVVSGSAIALQVTATGTPPPAYQWYKGATAISQATSTSYSKTWATTDAGTYKVVVSNIAGKDSSSTQLIVTTVPAITTQPISLTKCPGDSATLSVVAAGTTPLSYQWKKGSANIGANSPSLTINPVASAGAGSYTVIVSNMAGSDTSFDAVLSVNTVSSKPTIVPASPATCPGSPIILHLSGGTLGTGASWKWYTGSCGATLAGSDSTLTVNPSVNTVYYVRAEGGCQTTDCAFAQVTVNTIPSVTAQPASQTLWVGDSTTFSITATGTATLTYQWYRGTAPVGTNSPSLLIKPIAFIDSGNYTCVVTNSCGKDTSDVGKLTVFYAKAAAAGGDHSLFLRSDNTLWACGYNDNGQLGDSTTGTRLSPVKVMSDVLSMAAGHGYSLILKTDETLWACGANGSGQFGNGTTTGQTSPLKVMSGVKCVEAYNNFSLILKKDGTLLACGYNDNGQLGLGDNNERHTAEQVMLGVSVISAGYKHSLIQKSDTLWTCGNNWYGQLADGSTTLHSTPFQAMTGVQDIAAGGYFSLILKSNGTLWGCGSNGSGQLGQEDGVSVVPSPIEILFGVKKSAAGNEFSLILMIDGTLKACGANQFGQLGDGTNINRFSPVLVTTNVQSIASCGLHSFIIKTDGTLWAFGSNSSGTLGDGTTTDRFSPVQIKF
jgi:alpha-tubulin suppressor-like RCC1 family protein